MQFCNLGFECPRFFANNLLVCFDFTNKANMFVCVYDYQVLLVISLPRFVSLPVGGFERSPVLKTCKKQERDEKSSNHWVKTLEISTTVVESNEKEIYFRLRKNS